MEEIKWNEKFNLGVEVIDKAHQQLFAIVNRLIALSANPAKQAYACQEVIQYFKGYALKHFAEEEEYMRSIDYKDYKKHKRAHDKMREKVLPDLERELEEEGYSQKSVQHFMGTCVGWLNAHIIVEDRAIVEERADQWVPIAAGNDVASLARAVEQVVQKMFQVKSELISAHYGGQNFYAGHKLCYRLYYRAPKNELMRVVIIYEDRQIMAELSSVLGKRVKQIDRASLYAAGVLSEKFVEELKKLFPPLNGYRFEKAKLITFEQFARTYNIEDPAYSLLFQTEGYGQFALCVRMHHEKMENM